MPIKNIPVPIGQYPAREAIWGIRGTAKFPQLSVGGDVQVFYVDHAHANANDDNDGTDPDAPMQHLQALIDRTVAYNAGTLLREPYLKNYDTVLVTGDVAETVLVPGANVPMYVSIIGGGNGPHSPTWSSAAAAQNCLTVRREGWRISGFTFNVPTAAAGIKLDEVPGSGYSAYKTIIDDCVFDGLWGGRYGIDFSGAPHRVSILDNWFIEMHQAGNDAFCIYVTDSTHTNPYQCAIVGNRFSDSDNYVGSLGSIRGFNVSLFKGNIFEEGTLLIPAIYLDLRGGSQGYNIVTGNYFGGTYTNAGGYWANAATPASCWVGNVAEPTPVAGVADNGLTIAVPTV